MAFVWEQRKLGEVADIIGGGTPSTSYSDYWDGDIDWYAPAEISDQIFVDSSERKITKKGYENSSAKMLPVGAVLFTSRAGIGKTAILSRKGCTNQGFQSIVPHKDKLDSYFIFSRSEELKRYGETVGAGSTFVEVSGKQMANMELMLPENIEEQQVIGEYFKNLDHLITLHQRKRVLRKCFFSIAWEQRKLGDIVERESSMCASTSDIPSVEYEDVIAEEGQLNKDICSKEVVKTGIAFDGSQVLYGKLRPYLHNWLNPDFKGVAVGDWWVLKPINMDKNFLYRLIQTQKFDNIANQSSGSKMPRADWNLITNSEFVVPISKEEQCKIGKCFNNLDHLVTLHQWECNINENTEGNDEKQRKPIKKLIISEGDLSLVDDMFLLHRMTFFVCYKYILLRLNVVKYKITIIIINNILYSIVSLLIIACYLIVINKQLIILIYVEISVVIIKGDDDYARIRS